MQSTLAKKSSALGDLIEDHRRSPANSRESSPQKSVAERQVFFEGGHHTSVSRGRRFCKSDLSASDRPQHGRFIRPSSDQDAHETNVDRCSPFVTAFSKPASRDDQQDDEGSNLGEGEATAASHEARSYDSHVTMFSKNLLASQPGNVKATDAGREVQRSQSEQVSKRQMKTSGEISQRQIDFRKHKIAAATKEERLESAAEQKNLATTDVDRISAAITSNENVRIVKNHTKRVPSRLVNRQRKADRGNGSSSDSDSSAKSRQVYRQTGEKLDRSKSSLLPTEGLRQNKRVTRRVPVRVRNRNRIQSNISDTTSSANLERLPAHDEVPDATTEPRSVNEDREIARNCAAPENMQATDNVYCRRSHRMLNSVRSDDRYPQSPVVAQQNVTPVSSTREQSNRKQATSHDSGRLTSKGIGVESRREDTLMIENEPDSFESFSKITVDVVKQNYLLTNSKNLLNLGEAAVSDLNDEDASARIKESYRHQKGILIGQRSNNSPLQSDEVDLFQVHDNKKAAIKKEYENGLTSEGRAVFTLENQKPPKAKIVNVSYWPQDEETEKLFKSDVTTANEGSRNMSRPLESSQSQSSSLDGRTYMPVAKETNLSDPVSHQSARSAFSHRSQENQVSSFSNFRDAASETSSLNDVNSNSNESLPNGDIFCPKPQSVSIRRSNLISQSSFISQSQSAIASENAEDVKPSSRDGKHKLSFLKEDFEPALNSSLSFNIPNHTQRNLKGGVTSASTEKINSLETKKVGRTDADLSANEQLSGKEAPQGSLNYHATVPEKNKLVNKSNSFSYSSNSSSMESDEGDDRKETVKFRNPVSHHQTHTFHKSKRQKRKSFGALQSHAVLNSQEHDKSDSDEELTVAHESSSELTVSDYENHNSIDELDLNVSINHFSRSQRNSTTAPGSETPLTNDHLQTSLRPVKRFSALECDLDSEHFHIEENLFRPIDNGKETPESDSPTDDTTLENSLVQEEEKFNSIYETFKTKKEGFPDPVNHVSHAKSRSEPLENIHDDDIPIRPRRNAVVKHVDRLDDEILSRLPSKKVPNSNARTLPATLPRSVGTTNFEDFVSEERKKLDTRKCVILNLLETEDSYVDSLRILVENYLRPLKQPMNQNIYEPHLVEDVIFQVTQLLHHHQQLSGNVRTRYDEWAFDSVIGDLFIQAFSKDMLLKSYTYYINNFTNTKDVINNAIDANPAFKQVLEQSQRESRQGLADLMIKPVQRVPRYELIIKDLLKHTPNSHPDYESLLEAQKGIHALAVEMNKGEKEDKNLRLLQEIEQLIEGYPDAISVPRRKLLHQEICQELKSTSKKDRSLWLFNDMLLCTTVKKGRGSSMRRSTVNLFSLAPAAGNVMIDFTYRYRYLWKYSLSELDITRDLQKVVQPIRDDLKVLAEIETIAGKLSTVHMGLKEIIKEMQEKLNEELTENEQNTLSPNQPINQYSSLPENRLEFKVSTLGFKVHQFEFDNKDCKLTFEKQLLEAQRNYLEQKSKWGPTFLKVIPISKTRNGLQFSCATSNIETQPGIKEVWVCNTDGHVGQICFLTVEADPQQTQCLTVCNAKICCIAQVPPWNNKLVPISSFLNVTTKKDSGRRTSSFSDPAMKIMAFDESDDSDMENKSPFSTLGSVNSVSSYDFVGASNENHVVESSAGMKNAQNTYMQQLLGSVAHKKPNNGLTLHGSQETLLNENKEAPTDSPEPSGSMWMGTEDGKVHVYSTSEPIRTSKQSVQLNHGASVLCILHHFGQVFVALSNGELIVYKFDPISSQWDFNNKKTISGISSATPITKMVIVNDTELWCGCQNQVRVLSTKTHDVKNFFAVAPEKNKQIYCMASSGLGVWIALDKNPLIKLFHATTTNFLGQIDIKQSVNSMLSSSDAIIRQHKVACLRVTSLLVCKDSLWAGTSAGVVLTMALPNITPVTTSLPSDIEPQCLECGHTGHVRFLTSVEVEENKQATNVRQKTASKHRNSLVKNQAHSTMLVISGGDGYEDFDRYSSNEIAGKDDSTNHLLIWKV